MERSFQSLLLTGKHAAGDNNFPPPPYLNTEITSQTRTYQKPVIPIPSLNYYPYGSPYDVMNGNNNTIHTANSTSEISNEYRNRRSVNTDENLKRTDPIYFTPTIVFSHSPEIQPQLPPPAKPSYTEQARRRRHTLSEKTRSLQKVLPTGKKMDMATTYEEAYKYIGFLKAQIAALESMPVVSNSASSENPRSGGLGKLNRQQLLEVVVNSPASQSFLCSNGVCVYSVEQLILLKNIIAEN